MLGGHLFWYRTELDRTGPEEAVSFERAVVGGRKLMANGGDRRSEQFQPDNINLKTKGGTDPSYLLARLERDRPDVLNFFSMNS